MTLEQILEKTKNVRLVAASKYVDASMIEKLFDQGIVEFGENQVQALAQKKENLDEKKTRHKVAFYRNATKQQNQSLNQTKTYIMALLQWY